MRRALILLFAAVCAARPLCADQRDATLVNRNLVKMLEVAEAIEQYRVAYDRLPAATSPADLAKALAIGLPEEWFNDSWGTPYRILSDPEKGSYSIISAGSDGKFDPATWSRAGEVTDPREDTVLRDGKFVRSAREWARRPAGDAAEMFSDALSWTRAQRTTADVMAAGTAAEAYRTDAHHYPDAKTIDRLRAALEPKYLARVPVADAWQTPLRVECGDQRCAIVSAGADRKFDPALPSAPETTNDLAKDLVYVNGDFVRRWKADDAAEAHEAAASVFVVETRLEMLLNASPEERRKIKTDMLLRAAHRSLEEDPLVSAERFAAAVDADPKALDPKLLMMHADLLSVSPYPEAAPPPPPPGRQPLPPAFRDTPAAADTARVLEPLVVRYAAEHPDDARALRAKTDIILRAHSIDAALKVLESETTAHPQNGAAWTRLAELRFKAGDQAGSLAANDRAATLSLSGDEAYAVSSLYGHLGKPEKSFAFVERYANNHPNDVEAWYAYGVSAYERARTAPDKLPVIRKGEAALEKALQINPQHFQSMVYLNLLLHQRALLTKDPEQQKKLIERADQLRAHAAEIIKKRRAG